MTTITAKEKTITEYECSKHGPLQGSHCPYCSVCEHGKNENQQCDKCAADSHWLQMAITDAELEQVERQVTQYSGHLGIFRYPPMKRNCHTMPILPRILAEYRRLRADITRRDP
jgi:hypothetical protein